MSTKGLKVTSNKRWIIALLVCIVFVLAFSLTISERAYAADVIASGSSGTVTWSLDSDGVLTISGTGSMSFRYSTQCPWYSNKNLIKTVIISEGITAIGNNSFSECSNLTNVEIADSVTAIGYNAFKNCSSLSSINLPSNLKELGIKYPYIEEDWYEVSDYYGPFYGCSSLTSITLPEGIEYIPQYTFYGCNSLTSITLPDSVNSIGNSAFEGCSNLININIPDGVTALGYRAFKDCISLTSIILPDSLNNFTNSYDGFWEGDSYGPFYGCSSLTEINIPENINKIPYNTFYNCSSLTSIHIPESVTGIFDSAFSGCRNLTELTIPNSVTQIGTSILKDCRSLKRLSLPFIGGSTSYNYQYDIFGCIFGATKAYENQNVVPSTLKEVIITGDITSVPDSAFYGCNRIEKIVLPDSVTSIGYQSFYDCSRLTSINIPTSVTSIDSLAFDSCSSLSSIFIHESVTSIADDSFDGCTSLNDIYVVEGSYADSWLSSNGFGDQARYVTKSGDHYYYERIAAEPTCEQPGSRETFCVVCGDTTSESIPALGHDLQHHEGQAATCTEPGWYEYDTCSRCDYSTYAEMAALGHDLQHHEGKEGTCTEPGWKEYDTCSRCDYTTYEEITSDNHDFVEVLTKATLTKDGSVKHVCSRCGAEDPDAESIIISHPAIYLLYSTSYTYSGSAKKLSITIEDADEQIIDESNYTVTYLNNINVGTAIAKVTFNGEFYSGSKSLKYHITPKDLNKTKISLSTTSYTYDGAVKKPTVSVKDTVSGETVSLEEGTDYTVTYASGRKSVGTYKVTIKGEGNYTGTVTKTFKINPKGTTLKTLTATSKGFKATWTKQATKMSTSYITGYEIQYSTSSTFASGNKTVTVAKYSTVSKTISNLTAKKKYYVRIRTYKTVSGVKYYSPWSAKKYVTTKA